MTRTRAARRARIIALGAGASILAAVALAPVMTVGWCSDAPAGGVSMCHSESRSLLGAYAPWWLWAGVQATILVVTVVAVIRSIRRR